jgi:hypothetical protein
MNPLFQLKTTAAILVVLACLALSRIGCAVELPPGFVDLHVVDVPGSTMTLAEGINDRRQVVGYYRSPASGNIRQGWGIFFDFIVEWPLPCRIKPCGPLQPAVLNNAGDLVGSYGTSLLADTDHGFIHYADGPFITFDVPQSIHTYPNGINTAGQVSGIFADINGNWHGFIRNPGEFPYYTVLDVPGSVGTFGGGINDVGQVVGQYTDSENRNHGFIRNPDGRFITFDVPESVEHAELGFNPTSINNAGTVVGSFLTFNAEIGFRRHGFLRASNGQFTVIDLPGARNTLPWGINNLGDVSGFFDVGEGGGPPPDPHRITRGFILFAAPPAPPDCSGATSSDSELFPPNHKFKSINILGVTDPNRDPVTITINSIFQDEPVQGGGSGNTCPDAEGVGTSTARVRAERDGTGNGRVYHISFTADDGRGGTCTGEVTVCVPHDQGRGSECVDGGPLFDSTVCP